MLGFEVEEKETGSEAKRVGDRRAGEELGLLEMKGGDLRMGFERRKREARVEREKEEVEREWRAKLSIVAHLIERK